MDGKWLVNAEVLTPRWELFGRMAQASLTDGAMGTPRFSSGTAEPALPVWCSPRVLPFSWPTSAVTLPGIS